MSNLPLVTELIMDEAGIECKAWQSDLTRTLPSGLITSDSGPSKEHE